MIVFLQIVHLTHGTVYLWFQLCLWHLAQCCLHHLSSLSIYRGKHEKRKNCLQISSRESKMEASNLREAAWWELAEEWKSTGNECYLQGCALADHLQVRHLRGYRNNPSGMQASSGPESCLISKFWWSCSGLHFESRLLKMNVQSNVLISNPIQTLAWTKKLGVTLEGSFELLVFSCQSVPGRSSESVIRMMLLFLNSDALSQKFYLSAWPWELWSCFLLKWN